MANGSIFQSAQPINYGYQPLFEDRRPRNIGDTLTIVLQENVSASKRLFGEREPATARQTLALIPYRAICKVCLVTKRADVEASGGNSFKGKAARTPEIPSAVRHRNGEIRYS
ncbi:flagellar basal body L-ring protein FlgH [Shigella flexneri]